MIAAEAWVAAVIKVLRQAEDGAVRFTVPPRTELSAVAAFVTVSVEVQRLETSSWKPGTAMETLARFGQTSAHLLQT